MIDYDVGRWGISLIFRVKGSVFPKALCWAVPNAMFAIVLHYLFYPDVDRDLRFSDRPPNVRMLDMMGGVNVIWSGYTTVLGFLIVFRNSQAYSRFWEGAELIHRMRGEWINAISSVIVFCSRKEERFDEVIKFQHLLVRLSSMLHCNALQQVCELEDDTLEILDPTGISRESIEFLESANDKCEVVIQWIQRLIVLSADVGVIDIAPPILSRAFQEFSQGFVSLNEVRKIRDIPFPYPYYQMIVCMLIVHWFITPLLASQVIEAWWWCGLICLFVTVSFWAMFYIALEIDQPFGDDWNDLQVGEMQDDFNRSLLTLLKPEAQGVPDFDFKVEAGRDATAFLQCVKSNISYEYGNLSSSVEEALPNQGQFGGAAIRVTNVDGPRPIRATEALEQRRTSIPVGKTDSTASKQNSAVDICQSYSPENDQVSVQRLQKPPPAYSRLRSRTGKPTRRRHAAIQHHGRASGSHFMAPAISLGAAPSDGATNRITDRRISPVDENNVKSPELRATALRSDSPPPSSGASPGASQHIAPDTLTVS